MLATRVLSGINLRTSLVGTCRPESPGRGSGPLLGDSVSAKLAAAGVEDSADLIITPERSGEGLRDWKACDRAVAAGCAAMMARTPALVSTLVGQRQRPGAP